MSFDFRKLKSHKKLNSKAFCLSHHIYQNHTTVVNTTLILLAPSTPTTYHLLRNMDFICIYLQTRSFSIPYTPFVPWKIFSFQIHTHTHIFPPNNQKRVICACLETNNLWADHLIISSISSYYRQPRKVSQYSIYPCYHNHTIPYPNPDTLICFADDHILE